MSYLHRSQFADIDLIFFHLFLQVIDKFVIICTKKEEKKEVRTDAGVTEFNETAARTTAHQLGEPNMSGLMGRAWGVFTRGKEALTGVRGPRLDRVISWLLVVLKGQVAAL